MTTYLPMAHQKVSLKLMEKTEIMFDMSDPGSGKTMVQILAFTKRRKRKVKPGGCALIFAPKSLLRAAWEDDFKKFAPEIVCSVAYAENREKAFLADADVYITNIDATVWLLKQKPAFFKRFDTLICDEVSAYKNHTSARSKALNKIKQHFRYRSVMSGTPNSNTICDIWNPMQILDDGKRLGTQFYGFRSSVCSPTQVGREAAMVRWEDKDGAEEAVYGLIADITVRHRFEDCIDIPATHNYTVTYHLSAKQKKAYLEMEKDQIMMLAAKKGAVTAINAAAVTTKLLQIGCLAAGTEVLTNSGWKHIERITSTDSVWDGREWASCSGAVYSGNTEVMDCDGVDMTHDHNVLTISGWATAKEIDDGNADGRFDRTKVWLPAGFEADRGESEEEHSLAHAVRLREAGNSDWVKPQEREPTVSEVLRVQEERAAAGGGRNPRDDSYSAIQPLDQNQITLYKPIGQGLCELWRAGDNRLQTLGELRALSGGHGAVVSAGNNPGQEEQRPGLLESQLQVEHTYRAGEQYPAQRVDYNPERSDDSRTGGQSIQSESNNNPQANGTGEHRHSEAGGKVDVYDILNVLPRHRFTVRGRTGIVFIAHNSGAVYESPEKYHVVDTGRYELVMDLVEDRKHPLVFFLWKHQRDELVKLAEKRGLTFCVMDGNATDLERNAMVKGYQAGFYDVMFAHPKSAAHGLTLTKGTSTIWASPTYDLEHFSQGNKRQARAGQKDKTEIIVILAEGTIEEKVYKRLLEKDAKMSNLLSLFAA